MSPNLEAPTSIPVPSADLINYRFDQTDERFKEMNKKLDTILLQNSRFVSEDKVTQMISESLKPTQEAIKNYRWYWRSLVTAFLLAFLTSIASFLLHRG